MWGISMRRINNSKIGARLKKLRESRGIDKTDAALEFNIAPSQYGRIENGKKCISTEVLIKVCSYYNTSIDYILFGKNPSCISVFFKKIDRYSRNTYEVSNVFGVALMMQLKKMNRKDRKILAREINNS